MPFTFRFLIVAAFIPTLSLSGQQTKITETATDPTTESAEIRAQLDTIRGVEEMGLLRKQFDNLASENEKLTQRLREATEKIDVMQKEMGALRERQEQAARRRSALPELRLVAQVRAAGIKTAELSAGGRTFRVMDGLPFRLQLSNDEVLMATPGFQPDGTIKLQIDADASIDDVDTNYSLSFRPSTPDPSKAKNRDRANRDRANRDRANRDGAPLSRDDD